MYEKKINAYDGFNKNICPDGWDVPTLKQWQLLVESVGGGKTAGKEMKSNDNSYWSGADLTDQFGFSAISAGYFHVRKGYNARNDELMAVFTVHSFNSTESNAIRIYDTQDSVQFAGFGNDYYLAIRCIKK